MEIPVGYAQITHTFGGTALPRGAAVVYGVENVNSDPAVTVASVIDPLWQSNIMVELASTVTLLSTIVKLGPTEDGEYYVLADSQAGGKAVNACPPNTAILVRKQTAAGGRKNRGRMYVPGTDELKIDFKGQLTAAYVSDLQDAFTDYASALALADLPLVVLHTDPADTPTPITALLVDNFAATQRRRLR